MEDFKGTKGVWEVSYNTTAHLPFAYVICNKQESDEEAEANAKLIASAPELLEALLEVIKYMTAHIPEKIFEQVNNAIDKATE
jgi:hypothetical protein